MTKIHIVGIDPSDEAWQGLFDLLGKEVDKQVLSFSICPYDSTVTEEQIADCDAIIYLDMQPVTTVKPHVRLNSGEPFTPHIETLLKKLHGDELKAVVEEVTRIADEAEKRTRKERSSFATVLIVIAILLALAATGFSAWAIYSMTRERPDAADPFPGQPKDVAVCLGNLMEYQLFFQGKVEKPSLLCPASGVEYKFTVIGTDKVVSCPNPEKHDPSIKMLRVVGNNKPEVLK